MAYQRYSPDFKKSAVEKLLGRGTRPVAAIIEELDALGFGIEKDELSRLVPKALELDLDDGLWFGDVKVVLLEDQGEYGALRFDSAFQIGVPDRAKIERLSRVHFDVGFGDTVPGKIKPLDSPSLIKSGDPISWRVYPPEYIFSEKLQTLLPVEACLTHAPQAFLQIGADHADASSFDHKPWYSFAIAAVTEDA